MRSVDMMQWLRLLAVCLIVAGGSCVGAEETLVDLEAACGRNFSGTTGNDTISGSNYTHCTWQVTLTKPAQTAIVFKQFMLGDIDFVTVYDGEKDKNGTNLVLNVTGNQDAFLAVAFSKSITIELYKNSSAKIFLSFEYNSTGCLLAYLPSYARRVTAPAYLPNRGPIRCQYNILGLPQSMDKVAALAFTQFKITNGSLTVSDGQQTVTTNGSTDGKLPDDFISNQTLTLETAITINFSLDKTSTAQTFNAFYSLVDHSCSQVISITGNATISVKIPADQSPLTDCRIILKAQFGNTLLLNMSRVELESGSDKVMITDGGSLGSQPVSDFSSLPKEGNIVTSSGSELWVRLAVGELPGERTFTVHAFEQEYGGRFYKNGNISVKVNATEDAYYYQFVAPVGQVILTFSQQSTLFPGASLDLFDGTQPDSNLLVSFRTFTPFFPVTSSGNTMLLIARNFSGAENFSAEYHFVNETCDSLSSGLDGHYSLNPLAMSGSLCRWFIHPQTKSGFVILSIDKLTLDVNETVTVYSGVMESGMTVATFDLHTGGQHAPRISSPVGRGLELVYKTTCENCSAPVVKASFKVTQQECGGLLTSPTGSLTSPDYPNLYSLNMDCIWDATNTTSNVTSKQLFYLSFADFQLGYGHSVLVKDTVNKTTQVLAQYGGTNLPQDIIIPAAKSRVEFSSESQNRSGTFTAGRGFKATYWKLDCGGNLTTNLPSGSFSTPGYPKPVSKTTLCVWIIRLPAHGENSTVRNSVQFQIVGTSPGKTLWIKEVTIHDGGSLRDPILSVNMTKTGNIIARTNTIVVIYNYTLMSEDKGSAAGIKLNFSAFSCNSSEQCGGDGVCIHPDWVCNGVDDCGDMTDEKNCTAPPRPTPSPGTGGHPGLVNSYWIAVCLILGLLFGILLAFLIPAIYRRIKYPNYSQLRDLSTPVVT